jgi:prophage regulatory protein
MNTSDTRILRFPEVVNRTGLSRSTVYGRIRAGDFPPPVPLGGGRAVGFVEHEVNGWIDAMTNRRNALMGGTYGAA